MATADEHRKLIEEFYAGNGPVGDPADVARFFAPGYVTHSGPPGTEPGTAQAAALRDFLDRTFSEIVYELLHVVADDEYVCAHVRFGATHSGDGLGIPPTGRRVSAEQMHLVRLQDGLIAEHWGVRDTAAMMHQLTR